VTDPALPTDRSNAANVPWDVAPGVIRAAADGRRTTARSLVVVGVTGPVGSGKSTLARALGGAVLSTDAYLPDYDGIPYEERDRPESADLHRLAADLREFRSTGRARVPVWSFQSHRREGYRDVEAGDLLVVEGIHALHDLPHAHIDLAVFIEAPASVRWARWEAIESSGARGWGVEAAREYFDRVAEPTFQSRIAEYRLRARFIVHNAEDSPGGRP